MQFFRIQTNFFWTETKPNFDQIKTKQNETWAIYFGLRNNTKPLSRNKWLLKRGQGCQKLNDKRTVGSHTPADHCIKRPKACFLYQLPYIPVPHAPAILAGV